MIDDPLEVLSELEGDVGPGFPLVLYPKGKVRLRAAVEAQAEQIERLEDKLFALGAMEKPPCFCCGYNGPGYYNSKMHPCAKRHHELKE